MHLIKSQSKSCQKSSKLAWGAHLPSIWWKYVNCYLIYNNSRQISIHGINMYLWVFPIHLLKQSDEYVKAFISVVQNPHTSCPLHVSSDGAWEHLCQLCNIHTHLVPCMSPLMALESTYVSCAISTHILSPACLPWWRLRALMSVVQYPHTSCLLHVSPDGAWEHLCQLCNIHSTHLVPCMSPLMAPESTYVTCAIATHILSPACLLWWRLRALMSVVQYPHTSCPLHDTCRVWYLHVSFYVVSDTICPMCDIHTHHTCKTFLLYESSDGALGYSSQHYNTHTHHTCKVCHLCVLGVSQYIDISVYRNTRRINIVSQYEIRIAIYRDFSFF